MPPFGAAPRDCSAVTAAAPPVAPIGAKMRHRPRTMHACCVGEVQFFWGQKSTMRSDAVSIRRDGFASDQSVNEWKKKYMRISATQCALHPAFWVSFDTTSPLVRGSRAHARTTGCGVLRRTFLLFGDPYPAGDREQPTQAQALDGRLNQEEIRRLEDAALGCSPCRPS
jgi:hypothetical protein